MTRHASSSPFSRASPPTAATISSATPRTSTADVTTGSGAGCARQVALAAAARRVRCAAKAWSEWMRSRCMGSRTDAASRRSIPSAPARDARRRAEGHKHTHGG
ncbi:unnamed protein product [Closterium sp. NIES-54]